MVYNKGNIMARIIDKKVSPAEVRQNRSDGSVGLSYDNSRRDIILTVELEAQEINGLDYFAYLKKIKVGENLNLFFREATLWDGVITSVK